MQILHKEKLQFCELNMKTDLHISAYFVEIFLLVTGKDKWQYNVP